MKSPGKTIVCILTIVVAAYLWASCGSRITEDCVKFNPNTTTVSFIDGQWKIVDGSHVLFDDFGSNQDEAKKALRIIKYYGMNESCSNTGPEYPYLLASGKAPVGHILDVGEACWGFNPDKIAVKQIRGRWKIVEGTHWAFDFSGNEEAARKTFAIIKKYGFNKQCAIGRPKPFIRYMKITN